MAVIPASMASAATFTVTSCSSSGSGSLPYAVGLADASASGGTIAFANSLTVCPGHTIIVTAPIEDRYRL